MSDMNELSTKAQEALLTAIAQAGGACQVTDLVEDFHTYAVAASRLADALNSVKNWTMP